MSLRPDTPAPLSRLALVALCLAIVSMLVWPLAILSILLTGIAYLQMRDGSYRGQGYLYAALALSAFNIIIHFTSLFQA